MAQVKIYGRRDALRDHASTISDALQRAAATALQLPEDKRFHRFLPLEPWQLVAPPDRSSRYLIVEVVMFSGRSVTMRKAYVRAIQAELQAALGLDPADVEVVLIESPRENWGIRGRTGDELSLPYQVDV